MKFCHVLEQSAREVPEYRQLWSAYKQMKKQLNRFPRPSQPALSPEAMQAEEARFVEALLAAIAGMNAFRMERQASSVRTLEALQASSGGSREDKQRAYQDLVNFHGEVILLMHWSILAYTAVVKLLKKHARRTGTLVHSPQLRETLSQSSWSTEAVTALIAQAEACIGRLQAELFVEPQEPAQEPGGGSPGEVQGPRRPIRTPSNEVLLNTLASLAADREDSGEDSNGARGDEDGSADGGEDGAMSAGSCAEQPAFATHSSAVRAQPEASARRGETPAAEDVAGPSGHAAGPSGAASGAGPSGTAPPAAAAAAVSRAPRADNEPFINHALLHHMEDALRTWEYLGSNASTPSTVVRNPHQP